jgi:O-antigen/teichoic acid export membrane protein
MVAKFAERAPEEPALGRVQPQKVSVPIRRSLILSFVERYAAILINLLATAILARLLTPGDYGIYTVGVVIVGITATIRDFGVISFLMKETNLTDSSVRSAYGVSLLIGAVVGGVIVLASGSIADFYGNDGVREVLLVLAANFLLMPFASTVLALLRREMNFMALLWISLGSTVVSVVMSIGLALTGFGYMSLAWGTLAGSIVTCVMAAALRPKQFTLLPSLKEWRRITSFGVVAVAGIVLGEMGFRAPELVVGRLLDLNAVGILGRADGLTTMFNRMVTTAVAPVVVAAFALQNRAGNPLRQQFLAAMSLMTGIAWPFFAFLALMASPIINVLFGAGWEGAIPIARVLCIAASITVLADLNWYVIQALGEVRKNLVAQIIAQPVAVLLVLGAAQFNLVMVTGALIIAAAFSVVVSYRVIEQIIGATLDDVVRRSVKSVGVTLSSMIAPALVVFLMRTDGEHLWLPLAVATAGASLGWLLGILVFRHALRKEIMTVAAKVSPRFA